MAGVLEGRVGEKMNYNKKVLALHVVFLSVCLSADTNREPMIHRRYYCQTELRLCSLAYASLIMQIRSVRQNITAAVSQSGLRRHMNGCAFVTAHLETLK